MVRRLFAVFALLLVCGSIPLAPAAPLPAPLRALLDVPAAQAQVSDGGNFGSAVACLEAPDQFITSCFANTIVEYDMPDGSGSLNRVASSDTALVRFNTGGKTPLADLGQIGSVYGMAYDDGRVTGVRRVLLGAFARRMTAYGPAGPGGIYSYDLTTGTVTTFAQVPGATNRHSGDGVDQGVAPWVGSSSLGDLEIDPTGTTLYAANLDTRQIERYALASGTRQSPIGINTAITGNATSDADLRPFGLEFYPSQDGNTTQPQLAVGLIDTGLSRANPATHVPTAYVVLINTVTLAQSTILVQPLSTAAVGARFADGAPAVAGDQAWYGWSAVGRDATYAMPILSDIQFGRDGQTMLVGLRDRNGDVYLDRDNGQWWRVQAQGDTLLYRPNGGAWQLQTNGGAPVATDVFRDNYVGAPAAPHPENFMGALATTLTGAGNTPTEQLVGTSITPFVGGTSGANWYNLAPTVYDRQAAVEILAEGDLWKSATLGDLENLCTVAYVGDRVWNDNNGNGIQDAGEPGVGDVLLNLLDVGGAVVASATTNGSGLYEFAVQPGVGYTIAVANSNFNAGNALSGLIFAPQDRGGSDAQDSDVNQLTGRLTVPAQRRDDYNRTFDIGVMQQTLANGTVGDFVWNDLNSNGVQDGGEPGVGGVTVRLINSANGTVVRTTSTGVSGDYLFDEVVPGSYVVEFVPPAGINATVRDAGGDDGRDSDADASTGWRTPAFTITADVVDLTRDLGLIMGANVRISKTGPASVVAAGPISYQLTYANDGPAPATNVVVSDVLPAGLSFVSASPAPSSQNGQTVTWNFGTLAVGQSGTITLNAQSDGSGTAYTNQASITTTTVNDQPGDNTSITTAQVLRANVYAQKSGPATATVGDQLSYTLAYGNTGNTAAVNATLTDTLPAGVTFVSASPAPSSQSGQTVTWNLGTLAINQTGSITVVVQTSAGIANGTVLTNQVGITTTTPQTTTSDDTSSISTTLQRADVRVTKSSPTTFPVVSGQPVTYVLDYANAGPAAALNVLLTDTVPAQLTGVSWTCASGCSVSGTGNAISVNLGTLAPGATGRVAVTGTATTALAREDFTNTAAITTSTPETDTTNNQSSVPGAVWTSDIQVIKLADAQVFAGNTFNATLAYRNNGPAAAMAVVLVDTLPAGITFVSSSPAPASQSGQTITWNLGPLADTQNGQIALVLRSDAGMANNTTVVNQAQVTTTTTDRDASNNQSSAPTLVLTRADVAVVKTGPQRVTAGEAVPYTLAYRNNGPSIARAVVLSDTLPAGLDYLSASPAPSSQNGQTLTWNLGDLAPNQSGSISIQTSSQIDQMVATLHVTNTADVRSPTADDVPANNTSTATTAVETADVQVIKTSPPSLIAGAPFTVTLAYRNDGPARARSVVLRDLLPAGLLFISSTPPANGPGQRWNLGDLAGGQHGVISLVLRAPTTAISGTTYTNLAVIDTPTTPDRDPANDTSSTVSTVRPNAELAIVKTGPTSPVRSGDSVTYTLAYRNNGPSQAQNVDITDTLPAGFSLTSASPAPTTATATELTWNIGTLDAGASGTITVRGVLMGEGTSVIRTNRAEIGSPTTPDDVPGNNTATVTTPVQSPDLQITKTDRQTTVQPGDTLSYEIVVTNVGQADARGVVIRETPPAGVSVPPSAWIDQGDGSYTRTLGTIAAGASQTVTFSMVLPNPLPVTLQVAVLNTATVTDDGTPGPDPTPADTTTTDTDTPQSGRIGDRVWHDADADGVQDAGETGLGDVVVLLLDPATNAVLARTTTDAAGTYVFAGLRPGDYAVALDGPTTRNGPLAGFRFTTPPTPLGSVMLTAMSNMTLDIGLDNPASTAVVLAYLHADRDVVAGTATVRWHALEELNTVRYRVERTLSDSFTNASTVATVDALGSMGDGRYAVTDQDAPGNARYWLVEIERDGDEARYGPLAQRTAAVMREAQRLFIPLTQRTK